MSSSSNSTSPSKKRKAAAEENDTPRIPESKVIADKFAYIDLTVPPVQLKRLLLVTNDEERQLTLACCPLKHPIVNVIEERLALNKSLGLSDIEDTRFASALFLCVGGGDWSEEYLDEPASKELTSFFHDQLEPTQDMWTVNNGPTTPVFMSENHTYRFIFLSTIC